MKTWIRLWRDERGEVSSTATILLYTVLALGAIVGLIALRNQIVQELGDLAVGLRNLDQSFSITIQGTTHEFEDTGTDSLTDPPGQPPAGIDIAAPPDSPNAVPGENGL